MTTLPEPLEHVPAELHELMTPYLKLAKTIGKQMAEQATAAKPLPWPEDEGMAIVSKAAFEGQAIVEREMPTLPPLIVTAIVRQVVTTFADRLSELLSAAGAHSAGGSA